jgi:hypothetical protein
VTSKAEKERKKSERLQRDVLRYLKARGSKHYDNLYIVFDRDRSASIQSVLADLQAHNLISIDKQKIVHITDAGLERLAGS